jgi:hypothetical protein
VTTELQDTGEPVLLDEQEKRARAEAAAKGNTTYFTGKPCIWGHIAKRYTVSGECYDCKKMRTARKCESEGRKYVPKRGMELARNTHTVFGAVVGTTKKITARCELYD